MDKTKLRGRKSPIIEDSKANLVRQNLDAIKNARMIGSTWASIAEAISTPEATIDETYLRRVYSRLTMTDRDRARKAGDALIKAAISLVQSDTVHGLSHDTVGDTVHDTVHDTIAKPTATKALRKPISRPVATSAPVSPSEVLRHQEEVRLALIEQQRRKFDLGD